MGHRFLEILIPAMISALLLWEDVQCRTNGYRLNLPSQVTVQDGLCVYIPCEFAYPASPHDPQAQLYGYWYAEYKQSRTPRLVATNNHERIKEIDPRVRDRFEVSGPKLNLGDCSLTINYAEAADQATYHFRMEKGQKKLSYTAEKEKVSVTVAERKIDMTFVGPMRAGQRESIICKTQRCSSLRVPSITWGYASRFSVLETFLTAHHDSVEHRIDFKPTAEDHRQNVTCKVSIGEGSSRRIIEKTIMLDIHYHPKILPFRGYLRTLHGYVREVLNVSNGQVEAFADDTLLIHCEADANPPSNQTWVRTPSNSKPRQQISNNELKISRLRLGDDGKYVCEAKNGENNVQASFYLHVRDHYDLPMSGP